MFKIFSMLFSITALLFSSFLFAHVSNTTKAELSIIDNETFSIAIQADLLHILTDRISKNTDKLDDKQLITLIESMSMNELLKLLSETTKHLKDNTFVQLNNQSLPFSQFVGPTLNEVKKLIRLPAGNQGYPVIYTGNGDLSNVSGKITVQLPKLLGDTFLIITKPSHLFIAQGEQSTEIELSDKNVEINVINEKVSTAFIYIYQGFIHIIPKGLDHILFVLALFLLTAKFSTLLWQVSAFTLAHTITLSLGIFGFVNISASIVEPLIALSIAYVAIENIYANKLKKWRIVIIFIFGLLHGLGFASVLLELGLAPSQYVVSLIAFNVGVEIAQITVLLLALVCLYRFQQKSWYRQRIIQPLSMVIAGVGLYWFIERVI